MRNDLLRIKITVGKFKAEPYKFVSCFVFVTEKEGEIDDPSQSKSAILPALPVGEPRATEQI